MQPDSLRGSVESQPLALSSLPACMHSPSKEPHEKAPY